MEEGLNSEEFSHYLICIKRLHLLEQQHFASANITLNIDKMLTLPQCREALTYISNVLTQFNPEIRAHPLLACYNHSWQSKSQTIPSLQHQNMLTGLNTSQIIILCQLTHVSICHSHSTTWRLRIYRWLALR